MGQIFQACAYDIDTRTCCVIDADKFDANCYANCGTVFSMHYLLRQKSYRIMWGGDDIVIDGCLGNFSRTEDLLGISTYSSNDNFAGNYYEHPQAKIYYDKIKFIDDNSKSWKYIKVWDVAKKYFDWYNTYSVDYSGYLINHTQKQAVDLANYYEQSKYVNKGGILMTIDALPTLTETGYGTQHLFIDGLWVNSTEELAGKWCGDLLQIVDELPNDYQLINCCFAEIWSKARYCYRTFGVDKDGYLLSDSRGKLFESAGITFSLKRTKPCCMKVKADMNGVLYQNVPLKKKAKVRAEALAENEQAITELTQDLTQKDQDLAQKDQEIEALLKQLAELKKQT